VLLDKQVLDLNQILLKEFRTLCNCSTCKQ